MKEIDEPSFNAFTQKWDGHVDKMISDAHLKSGDTVIPIKALWDTGASRTCISLECVTKLNLVPIGRCTNMTASGPSEARTYLVDVLLPNKVIVPEVMVTDARIGTQGFDILIGMDLISIGDFSVSNFEGKTTLSYRIPSKQVTDYVQEINRENMKKLVGTHGPGKRKKKNKR